MDSISRETLCLLIDVNPIAWSKMKDLTIHDFMQQLFVYLKQMILSDQILPPSVIAYNQCKAEYLYPSPVMAEKVMDESFQPTNTEQINQYFDSLLQNLKEFNQSCASLPRFQTTRVDVALSLALCHLNGFTNQTTPKRILVFSVSEDRGSQYDNILFTAKRVQVTIDSLFLNPNTMCFLKQAADMTNGFSKYLTHPRYLIQYLLALPPLTVRHLIALPSNPSMNYFAPSVDTGNMISYGYLCPTCLSIFEKPVRMCPVCESRSIPANMFINMSQFDQKNFDELTPSVKSYFN